MSAETRKLSSRPRLVVSQPLQAANKEPKNVPPSGSRRGRGSQAEASPS